MSGEQEKTAKKPSKLEQMKAAVGRKPDKVATVASPKPKPGAELASPPAGKKSRNPRNASSRDERAAKRGRLPKGAFVSGSWSGRKWTVSLLVPAKNNGPTVYQKSHTANGLFQALEAIDHAFWCWVATEDPAKVAKLEWEPDPPAPDKYPKGGGTPEVATVASPDATSSGPPPPA
jgi:hypothetical protein